MSRLKVVVSILRRSRAGLREDLPAYLGQPVLPGGDVSCQGVIINIL